MGKAKFIRRYYGSRRTYDDGFIYMDYEYRGHEYTVYENRRAGNEPLSWQHKTKQASIDKEIEIAEKAKSRPHKYEDTAEYGFDVFWDYVNS